MNFREKKVIVTGGTRGIGYAISKAFAQRGAQVAMVFRTDRNKAEQTLLEIREINPEYEHLILQADLSDPGATALTFDRCVSALGGVDIVVNNAGIGINHSVDSVCYEDWQDIWQKILACNLLGPANLSFCASKHMIAEGGGRIVNIASRGAYRGEPEKPAYGASKAGLISLGQSLAVSLAPYKIFVGTVAPGFVETDLSADLMASEKGAGVRAQSPLGRIALPEEVAHAVLFLASEGAEFSTGTVIDVNGASYLR
ncbi:MAG: SDR family NAD(P)-dependent oxidoreductase [Gammaproteobacteria bacterium]|nr:SDR family NAD(P)-dependent oxidoreductase [Gammaproteobacteria bacterium]MDG1952619.1 SDR family NAD(P)-dependent oxidoreductase [Gammaproteobacteria bacterium]